MNQNPQTITTTVTTRPRRNRRRGNARRNRPGQQGGGQPPNKPTTRNTGVTFPDLLSPCARDYLSVLENPWSGKVSCVPTIPSIPSRKVRYWVKGVLQTGTAQVGFVAFNPFNITNNVTAENERSVYYTNGAFAGTFMSLNSATPGVATTQLNSEFGTAGIAGVRYRLVAAGLRVRYSGTELNRGGRVFCLEEPDHADMDTFDVSSFSEYEGHRVFRPDQQWKSVTFHPADEDEFDYYDFSSRIVNKFLGILVEAPSAAVSTSFEFEATAIFELIGQAARGLTSTPVDLVGLSAVQTFTNSPATRVPREGDRSNWVHYALNQTGRLLWDMGSGMLKAYFDRPSPSKDVKRLTSNTTTPIIEFVE